MRDRVSTKRALWLCVTHTRVHLQQQNQQILFTNLWFTTLVSALAVSDKLIPCTISKYIIILSNLKMNFSQNEISVFSVNWICNCIILEPFVLKSAWLGKNGKSGIEIPIAFTSLSIEKVQKSKKYSKTRIWISRII